MSSAETPEATARTSRIASSPEGEFDFRALAARVAAQGGGRVSPEVSRELALDIVLNEIVEEARAATGAAGAAIALRRGGEMVCRASGGNAPELGSRLSSNSGLTGICVRTAKVQVCDDTLTDRRVDGEVSRQMGVRSVLVQPIVRDREVLGIAEIFSPRAGAFGERDGRKLEALTDRVLKNILACEAAESSVASAVATPAADDSAKLGAATPIAEAGKASSSAEAPSTAAVDGYETAIPEDRGFDWVASLIGAIVVLVALLMGAVLGMRVGWLKGNVAGRASGAAQALKAPASSAISSPASSSASSSSSSEPRTSSNGPVDAVGVTAGGENKSASGSAGNSAENDPTPEGGLRVFENGREIFRMDAAKNAPRTATTVATQPNVAEGGLFLRVEPKYPEQALAQRVQGPVVLKIGITAEGTVQEIKIVSGAPILADAAIAAVRQWRFRPRTEGGRAVGMETQITLNFTLPSR